MGTRNEIRRDLHLSSIDSFLSSVMVGAGETFLPAFALAMGLGAVTAGLIASVPFLIGSLFQLAAPHGLRRLGSYRRWLTLMGMLQGLSFLPLVIFAEQGKGLNAAILFAVVTVYWGCGLASGPAWSSWMAELVPAKVRSRYFAKRSHLGQVGLLTGLVVGGTLLEIAKRGGWEMNAFVGIFLASGFFRIASAWCLSRQSDCPHTVKAQKPVGVRELVGRLRTGRDGKMIAFLLIFSAAIHLAAPFFNPFMLNCMKLSYGPYMGFLAAGFIAKIGTYMVLARFANRWKPLKLMRWGIIGAALLPMFWVLSSNHIYMSVIHILGGAVWALYELGMMLVLFNAIRDEERTSFLTWYNFASAFMVLAGSLIGGKVLAVLGDKSVTYFMIFGLSAAARLLSLIVFDEATAEAQAAEALLASRAGGQQTSMVTRLRPRLREHFINARHSLQRSKSLQR